MRQLNCQFCGLDYTTDVLAFSQFDGQLFPTKKWDGFISVGDIVISIDSAQANAKTNCVNDNTEIKRLIIHGILHLNGYDHDKDLYGTMINIQERIFLHTLEYIIR